MADGELASIERESGGSTASWATRRRPAPSSRRSGELAPLPALEAELRSSSGAAEAGRKRTLTETEATLVKEIAQTARARVEDRESLRRSRRRSPTRSNGRGPLDQTQRALEGTADDWVRDKQEAETKRQALLEQLKDVPRAARANRRAW